MLRGLHQIRPRTHRWIVDAHVIATTSGTGTPITVDKPFCGRNMRGPLRPIDRYRSSDRSRAGPRPAGVQLATEAATEACRAPDQYPTRSARQRIGAR